MIIPPHFSTTLLYDVLRRCSTNLIRCLAVSSSEDMGAPGETVPFSLEPILLELEVGRYVGPLIPTILTEMFSGRCDGVSSSGGSNSGSYSGSDSGIRGGGSGGNGRGAGWSGASTGTVGAGGTMRVHYEAHLPELSLWYRENLRTILTGVVLPKV